MPVLNRPSTIIVILDHQCVIDVKLEEEILVGDNR
jgi:hypothetical protein